MTTPAWPGIGGLPALPSRALWQRKSIQLPFASDAIPPETDAPEILWGTGSPENAVVGTLGDTYVQQDTVRLWEKRSGVATATGWRAVASLDAATDLDQVVIAGGFRQTIDGWYQENVAASQTDVALTRLATTTEAPTRWIAVRAGSMTGVNVKSNEARVAGTLTVKVFKNGAALGTLTAVLDGTNTAFKATTQAKDVDAFAAGDELELRITTDGSWSPTTADIRASLEIET
jgi:hypothetical protein